MATYEELSKFLDDYNPNRQPVLQQEDAYNQMVRERFGPPDKESLDKEWNQYRTSIGKGTYNPENTERHIINSLEHYYSMGIIVFLVALISCNFKTALKAFFGWCVFCSWRDRKNYYNYWIRYFYVRWIYFICIR